MFLCSHWTVVEIPIHPELRARVLVGLAKPAFLPLMQNVRLLNFSTEEKEVMLRFRSKYWNKYSEPIS